MFRSLTKCHFSSRLLQLKSHLIRHQLSTLNTQQSSTSPNPNLKGSLNDLNFINTAVNALPIDPNPSNKTRLTTGYNYSKVTPTPRDNPRIISTSAPALELLDLDKAQIEKNPENVLYLSGNSVPSKADPIAHCYCGHQFGSFAGQLGDGRAITLGDIKNNKGEIWELQLKGAGETPYSRFADGKAVLRSSIREYLCSEAMWALGIPTTRAASLVVTDTLADRDQFYNGNVKKEKCALVLRLAPTFWRFGSFEIFKVDLQGPGREGPSAGMEEDMMPNMLNYILNTFYPEIAKLKMQKQFTDTDCWLEMLNEITRRTAKLVALWQCYGFCHGVLNTDNMSVLGLTIDYGPFGWMDYFNKRHICNTSDHGGRYSYENQPQVGKWNLWKLAEALDPFVPFEKSSAFIENEYDTIFKEHYYSKMREKLGLYWTKKPQDEYLIDELFDEMHLNASDFTNTFRLLATVPLPKNASESNISPDLIKKFVDLSPDLDVIASRQKPTYTDEQIVKLKDLAKNNPQLLKVWGITQEIIEREEQSLQKYKEYLQLDDQQRKKDIEKGWTDWLKNYENRLLAETQEGSNKNFEELQQERVKKMNKTNPAYVLRNFIAEEVIRQANKDDFSGVNDVLELLLNPFEIRNEEKFQKYTRNPPKWAAEICVSCSS